MLTSESVRRSEKPVESLDDKMVSRERRVIGISAAMRSNVGVKTAGLARQSQSGELEVPSYDLVTQLPSSGDVGVVLRGR